MVDAVRDGGIAIRSHVGRYVGVELGVAAHIGVRADPGERHEPAEAPERRALADLAVSGDAGVVDDDRAVADATIVRHVAHPHQQAAVADLGPSVRPGRAVDRDVLADVGVGADPDAARRALLKLEVLRPAAQHRAVAHLRAVADLHAALEHAVMADLHVGAQRHLGTDDREGAHPNPRVKDRLRVYERRRMHAVRLAHPPPPRGRPRTPRSRGGARAARDAAPRYGADGPCPAAASGRP